MIDFPTQPWIGNRQKRYFCFCPSLPQSNCLLKSPAAEPGWDIPLLHKLHAKQIKPQLMDKALAQEGRRLVTHAEGALKSSQNCPGLYICLSQLIWMGPAYHNLQDVHACPPSHLLFWSSFCICKLDQVINSVFISLLLRKILWQMLQPQPEHPLK